MIDSQCNRIEQKTKGDQLAIVVNTSSFQGMIEDSVLVDTVCLSLIEVHLLAHPVELTLRGASHHVIIVVPDVALGG